MPYIQITKYVLNSLWFYLRNFGYFYNIFEAYKKTITIKRLLNEIKVV